jgi:hypothetical protein
MKLGDGPKAAEEGKGIRGVAKPPRAVPGPAGTLDLQRSRQGRLLGLRGSTPSRGEASWINWQSAV